LQDNETRLRLMFFENSPVAVGVSRLRDGKFLDINAAFVRLYGYAREEVIGHTSDELQLWHSRNREAMMAELREKTHVVADMQGRGKSGRIFDLLVSVQVVEWQGETCMMGMLLEVTERRRAEAALQESERLLHTVINLVPHPIFAKDRHSRHLLANEAWAALNGRTPEQMLGRTDLELIPDRAQAERFMRDDREVIDLGRRKFMAEEALTNTAGQTRILQTIKIPFESPVAGPSLLGVAVDITQRHAQAVEIERLNRLYATLSGVNQTIVRCQSRAELFDDICRIMTESGKFHGARIDEQKGPAGAGSTMVMVAHQFLAPASLPNATCGEAAMRTGRPELYNYAATGPGKGGDGEAPLRWAIQACAAFPLRRAGKLWGTFSVSSAETDFFKIEEMRLLEEVAADISHALDRLAGEAQRREAVEGLQAYRMKLEAALGSMTDAVSISDVEGVFIEFNEAFATFHRFRSKSECARTFAEYPAILEARLPGGEAAPVEQWAVPRALRGETGSNVEYTLRRKDTGESWVGSYSFSPLRDAQGGMAGSVVVARDITQRRQVEEALRLSEMKFSQAFANNPAAIILTRLEDGVVLEVNDSWVAMSGYRREEVMGRSVRHMWPTVESAARFVGELREKGVVRGLEQELRNKSGRLFAVQFASQCMTFAGEKVILSTFVDVTARKQAEEELRELNRTLDQRVQERTAELRASNEELDAFAYAVSHDLRAPLRAMSGFSQALREDFGAQLPAAGREYLEHIQSAGRQMGELINGLLHLSRRMRGTLQRDTVDLSVLATRILEDLQATEPRRCVTWSVEPGLAVNGDARLFEVVMLNLLGNAWKYTGGTPQAIIQVYRRAAAICVADNGAGFNMKHAAKLFQPFQRLHREEEFPGLGIGLATVQRIIRRHGGEIRASAAPGGGATFSFNVPPTEGQDPNHQEASEVLIAGGGQTER
jgi:PAS domain S-box-containing protein